jgi:hypothetical protein
LKILWITQMQADGNDEEIARLEVEDTMWDRLHRVFPVSQTDLKAGHVLIELMDGAGDTILSDEPLVIPDHQGQWLLRDFFQVPAKVYRKVKTSLLA